VSRTHAAALVAILLAPVAPVAAQQAFTLEQVMSAPFPTALVTAPTGAVAWVFNDRGARNVWVAEPPAYRARAVTRYVGDDGQELSALRFTPDGRAIVFVRGGAPNGRGEIPNPQSDPAGAERAIWIVGIAGGAPRRVATGAGPALAPDGKSIAYGAGGTVMLIGTDSGAVPRTIIRARGGLGTLRWSPDGSKLAFASSRGVHAFVGVYDVSAKQLRWMDPGVDSDQEPVWSPDGRQLAFARIPADFTPRLFVAEREGEPWSIRVADVATGASREIFRAARGAGSVYREIVGDRQLHWTADGFVVFPWEKDGWTHLYAVPAAGGTPRLLTPGDGEVEHVSISDDGRAILYASNQADRSRRDLYRVSAAGGAPVALTSGQHIEWSPVMTGDARAIAYLRSDARGPARPAIMSPDGSGQRDLAPEAIPASFPASRLVEPQVVTFEAADGMRIPAQLFLPPGARAGARHPAVVFLHGGSRRQMLPGWNYGEYYANAYAFNQYLASRGYVVLSVNFRSGIGYGMEFREALRYGAGGASEFADVLGAGLWLRARPDVDGSRIGLWGGSYGGYLTAMGLSRASDLFAAGVDVHGVHDWNNGIRNFVPAYDPLAQVEAARLALLSSPMSSLDGWRSPVLLIHGDDDRNVAFTETGRLVEQLRRRGVEHEVLVFPDEVHGFLRQATWLRAYGAASDFLDRKLRAER
jgi:dipeptidyl aminopeptidase/acylaminoacyl peptidase